MLWKGWGGGGGGGVGRWVLRPPNFQVWTTSNNHLKFSYTLLGDIFKFPGLTLTSQHWRYHSNRIWQPFYLLLYWKKKHWFCQTPYHISIFRFQTSSHTEVCFALWPFLFEKLVKWTKYKVIEGGLQSSAQTQEASESYKTIGLNWVKTLESS